MCPVSLYIYIYIWVETSCWVCMATRRFPGLGSPHSPLQSIILKPGEVHERFSSERFIKRDPVIQSCPLRSSTNSPIGITGATDMQRALYHGVHTHYIYIYIYIIYILYYIYIYIYIIIYICTYLVLYAYCVFMHISATAVFAHMWGRVQVEVPPELYKLKARWERLKSELGKTMRSTRTTKIPKCGVGSKVSDQRA